MKEVLIGDVLQEIQFTEHVLSDLEELFAAISNSNLESILNLPKCDILSLLRQASSKIFSYQNYLNSVKCKSINFDLFK